MKLKLLALLLFILQVEGYAQKNKIFGVFAGGGIATANNTTFHCRVGLMWPGGLMYVR